MQTSQKGINFIKSWEAFSPTSYLDAGGRASIGYGHVILQGQLFDTITEDQASALMAKDLQPVESQVNRYVGVALTQNQFDALVSLCYNVGYGPLIHTLGRLLNQSDYAGAAQQFLGWDNVNHQECDGLLNRREAEVEIFNNNIYPTH